ncbi:unnamed protein product [Symbiodinium natans]|uniref:Uncharacterized protein n=1 Tax=Symbiodinium natans TaxID=878477 RepID=A0A812KCK4_9DINO|nr:unnamed protein product [Symbiodinium natans]
MDEGVSETWTSAVFEKAIVFYIMVTILMWSWKADVRRCLLSLQSFVHGLLTSDEEKEAAIHSKLQEIQLPLARQLTAAILGSFTLITVLMDLSFGLRRSSRIQLFQDYVIFGAAFFFASLASKWTMQLPLLYKMTAVEIFLGVLHTILSDSASIMMMIPIKMMLRLCASSMLLSERFAIVINTVASMSQLIRILLQEESSWLPSMIILELGTGLLSVIPIVLLKSSFAELLSTAAVEDASQFFHEHSAARRMLAVLCDAQVLLGPDLKIISHDRGLAQLLMSSCSPFALEGRAFLDFMAPRDIHRFEVFIESAIKVADEGQGDGDGQYGHGDVPSGMPSGRSVIAPPTSLLVHISDSHGLLVAVELFHICVPAGPNGVRGHFIGISEAESNASATASNSDTGSGSVRSSHRTDRTAPLNAARHSEESQEVMTLKTLQMRPQAVARSAEGMFHPDPGAEDEGRDGRESVASSGSSDSSLTSAAGLRSKSFTAPGIESAEITLDPFCDALSIHEAFFTFQAGSARERPCLMEWLWPGTGKKFHSSMSHAVNLLFAPPGSRADAAQSKYRLEPITFQLPSWKKTFALVAKDVDLLLEEKEEGHALGSAAQEAVLIKLQLSSFMIKRMERVERGSRPQKPREIEERAKARAEWLRANSGSRPLAERDGLEPIQEQRLRRTHAKQRTGEARGDV